MKEPYLTRFKQLILSGSASRDIHDAGDAPTAPGRDGARASAAFLMREVDRVRMHAAGLCVLLADHIATAAMVLDVGCGTGGTTVALALSALAPKRVIGVDADASTLEAAEVRALGHDLQPQRVSFQHVPAGEPLPFASASFDLVTCVSVLEFITLPAARERFIRELLRVLRPGGYLFLATPSPFRLRDYHSHRLFGDWRRTPGHPWATPPWVIARWLRGQERVPLAVYRVRRRRALRFAGPLAGLLQWAFPWQQWLVIRREAPGSERGAGTG
jgi:ubiquinone/menaquinone biosynthesis C-methylase UbiE